MIHTYLISKVEIQHESALQGEYTGYIPAQFTHDELDKPLKKDDGPDEHPCDSSDSTTIFTQGFLEQSKGMCCSQIQSLVFCYSQVSCADTGETCQQATPLEVRCMYPMHDILLFLIIEPTFA